MIYTYVGVSPQYVTTLQNECAYRKLSETRHDADHPAQSSNYLAMVNEA